MTLTRRRFVSGAALLCAAPSLATLGCEIEHGVCTAYVDCLKPGEEEAAFQESLDSFWDGFGPREFTSLEGQARWLWLPSEQHEDGSFAQSSRTTAEGSSIAPWARFGDRDGYVESLQVVDDESGRHVTLNNRWSDPSELDLGPFAERRDLRFLSGGADAVSYLRDRTTDGGDLRLADGFWVWRRERDPVRLGAFVVGRGLQYQPVTPEWLAENDWLAGTGAFDEEGADLKGGWRGLHVWRGSDGEYVSGGVERCAGRVSVSGWLTPDGVRMEGEIEELRVFGVPMVSFAPAEASLESPLALSEGGLGGVSLDLSSPLDEGVFQGVAHPSGADGELFEAGGRYDNLGVWQGGLLVPGREFLTGDPFAHLVATCGLSYELELPDGGVRLRGALLGSFVAGFW